MGRTAMPRKKRGLDEFFELLTIAPVWVGPLLAGVSYPVFRFLIPRLLYSGDTTNKIAATSGKMLADIVQSLSPYVPLFIIVAWGLAELKKFTGRRRLDATSGLDDIRGMSWSQFEKLVAEAYRRKGYVVEERGGPSGDGGVDLVLRSKGEVTLVQCKRWKARRVGVSVVRELFGVMHAEGAAAGIVATCGDFTREARAFAEQNGVALVAGESLARLIDDVRSSGPQRTKGTPRPPAPHVARERQEVPTCPTCGSGMVIRTAKRGPNVGGRFWGCQRFPRCRGTRKV
jgi:restriction system protein